MIKPLAITMWDFSWIERRWSGAGFEDWDLALTELAERGYDAVRIDAFPHLLANGADKEWTLLPVWYSNDWGSPYKNKIRLFPEIVKFIAKCKEYKIKVALSSWYREDLEDTRMLINSPKVMAENWIKVLKIIENANLLDTILYVDFCNEWPGDFWAPYFENEPKWMTWSCWHTGKSMEFMKESLEIFRSEYNDIPVCYSFDGWNVEHYKTSDLSFFDLIEHHIWMAKLDDQEFYREMGLPKNARFSDDAYHRLSDYAYDVYSKRPDYWKDKLVRGIKELEAACENKNLPLCTTECWGIVDYKDYPLLRWDFIKDLCELGVNTAISSGKWGIIATSNFAAPQFVGMWRDVAWHKKLTDAIHNSTLSIELGDRLKNTMTWKD